MAITDTEKAAGEIAERVRAKIGRAARERPRDATISGSRPFTGSVRGFCDCNPFEAGVDPLFTVAAISRPAASVNVFRDPLAALDGRTGGVRDLL